MWRSDGAVVNGFVLKRWGEGSGTEVHAAGATETLRRSGDCVVGPGKGAEMRE